MSFKTTYILFAVLIALVVVFGLTQMFGRKPGEELYVMHDMRGKSIRADDIDRLEIDRHRPTETKMVFVRQPDKKHWQIAEPFTARADGDAVTQLIRNVMGARREEHADVTPDLAKFGLETPAEVITLKQGDKEWTLNLGDESPGSSSEAVVYITTGADPKRPAAVKHTDLEGAFKQVNDFRAKDLLAETGDLGSAVNVQEVRLRDAKGQPVVLARNALERWDFQQPPYGPADYEGEASTGTQEPKRVTGVRELLTDIDGLRVESSDDFVANGVIDMAKYGLDKDKPERLKIEVKRKPPVGSESKEPVTRILLVGKKADDKGDKLYARLENENDVVRIPAKSIDPIAKVTEDPAVLRDRNLLEIEQTKADAIDIKTAAGLVKLRKPQATWEMFESGKPRAADDSAVSGLLTSLDAKRLVRSFPDPARESELGFDKPDAVVVSIWAPGLQPEEKKDKPADTKGDTGKRDDKQAEKKPESAEPKLKSDKPTARLVFGKKDGQVVFVRREWGDSKTIVAVNESLLAKVNQGPLAYLDRTLHSFPADADTTALVLERGGETFELEKEQKDGKTTWKLKQPKEMAGRPADAPNVDRMLAELRDLRTDKLVADKPTPQALEDYGLSKPALKATVKVQNKDAKKTEDWVFLFGKPTEGGRYAKQSNSDLVFVAKPAVTSVLESELQDPTVFHFDQAKVRAVKLVGWKQVASFTFTLEAERKQGSKGWTVKTPPDFDLNGDQLDALLATLADLKAQRYVTRQGGPRPEHKLSPADRQLQIELSLDGEKAPLTLTLGALDPKEKAYYAQASALPGVVFLVAQDRFEQLLTGPKYLSRTPQAASR
jgi:hypothetical protein